MEFSLSSDPNGLLPINACAPGEELIYLEDFQDGEAQDWMVEGGPPDSWIIKTRSHITG